MNSVYLQLLRRMRGPLIFVIISHAMAVLGLTLIPGADLQGRPAPPLDFFHAFYFITYTATTIGYTEPVHGFSDAQRLWITGCIYLLVTSWSFVIVTLLACFQDQGLQKALVTGRFMRRLRRLREPFYLICGYGEAGGLIGRSLDQLDRRFVVVDQDNLRLQELELEDYRQDNLALHADVRQPKKLLLAGIRHRRCRAVLALSNDEATNLAVVVSARLLNPEIPVLARCRSAEIAANMRSFGAQHIINPFERFAEYLSLAVVAPERYHLIEILTGLPGTPLPEVQRPPRGHWIVCGYGVFGRAVVRNLEAAGVSITIIDPEAETLDVTEPSATPTRVICGHGTQTATLQAAHVTTAQGIVAGSDNDVRNLAIAVTARELNPALYVVTRQNLAANSALFDAFVGDFCLVPSRIVAQEGLAILTTPLLAHFLQQLRRCGEQWSRQLSESLQVVCADQLPEVWSVTLNAQDAGAVHKRLILGQPVQLGQLLSNNTDRSQRLPIVALLLERSAGTQLLPTDEVELNAGDQLLFAAAPGWRRHCELSLQNANVLAYLLADRESGGWLWRQLSRSV